VYSASPIFGVEYQTEEQVGQVKLKRCCKVKLKGVPVGGAMMPERVLKSTLKKAQLRAPPSPLQTAWTGFDPNLYSGGSSSAGPALVEIATARSLILNRCIVTDTMSATPLEPGMVSSAFHSTKSVVSQVGALRTGLQAHTF